MATIKQLLDTSLRVGSRQCFPTSRTSVIRTDFSGGTGTYTAPCDGWLMVRATTTKELIVWFLNLQFYQTAQISQNIAFTVPLRKGQSASISWNRDYEGNQCWGVFSPCG